MQNVFDVTDARRHVIKIVLSVDSFGKKEKKLFEFLNAYDIIKKAIDIRRVYIMRHIKTLNTKNLKDTMKKGGCGECQTSCQSACKTSCTVGNQSCENK